MTPRQTVKKRLAKKPAGSPNAAQRAAVVDAPAAASAPPVSGNAKKRPAPVPRLEPPSAAPVDESVPAATAAPPRQTRPAKPVPKLDPTPVPHGGVHKLEPAPERHNPAKPPPFLPVAQPEAEAEGTEELDAPDKPEAKDAAVIASPVDEAEAFTEESDAPESVIHEAEPASDAEPVTDETGPDTDDTEPADSQPQPVAKESVAVADGPASTSEPIVEEADVANGEPDLSGDEPGAAVDEGKTVVDEHQTVVDEPAPVVDERETLADEPEHDLTAADVRPEAVEPPVAEAEQAVAEPEPAVAAPAAVAAAAPEATPTAKRPPKSASSAKSKAKREPDTTAVTPAPDARAIAPRAASTPSAPSVGTLKPTTHPVPQLEPASNAKASAPIKVVSAPDTFERETTSSGSNRRWTILSLVPVLVLVVLLAISTVVALTGTVAPAQTAAAGWLTDHVDRDSRMIVDEAMSPGLVAAGWDGDDALWSVATDAQSDPVAAWRDADYVVSTDAMRDGSARLPQVASAIANSVVVASFGTGDTAVDVRRVMPEGAVLASVAETRAAAERAQFGSQLAQNPALLLADADRAALTDGRVDNRIASVLGALAAEGDVTVAGFPVIDGEQDGALRQVALRELGGEALVLDGQRTARASALIDGLAGRFAPDDVSVRDGTLILRYPLSVDGFLD